MSDELVIQDGDSVDLTAVWTDKAGVAANPTSVRYRVFDKRTKVPIASSITVLGATSTMTFTVPGANLPSGDSDLRTLVIQVEGTFGTDKKTQPYTLHVRRTLAFA